MRLLPRLFLFSALLSYSISVFADHVELKEGFVSKLVSSGLVAPTALDIAPDGRIFITEKEGEIRIIENGQLLPTPFLDIEVDESGERGLGSVLLDPEFDNNGYVYIYYTVPHAGFNRISRFTANGNLSIPQSEFILMDLDIMSGNIHNSGAMRWGTDSTLFVAIGDGRDPKTAQDTSNLLGSIIRLNRDGSIPEDNPFYDAFEGKNKAIYAFGLRNSFTMDINKRTGQILANDVGQENWEEVNNILSGMNYGWPIIEGKLTDQTPPKNYQDPLYAYGHGDGIGCAVVGGAFYVPDQVSFPESWLGTYLFSDMCTGFLLSMDPETGEILDTLHEGVLSVTNLLVGDDGHLYYLNYPAGEIWEVFYNGTGAPFISRQPEKYTVVVGEEFETEVNVVGQEPLVFEWFLDGQKDNENTSNEFELEDVMVSDDGKSVHCKIYNDLDTVWSDTIYLDVTENNRPVITITKPDINTKYNNGDTLWFAGSANDLEDGDLDSTHLTWKIDFHHDEHFHPGMPATSGLNNGYVVIPRSGETDTNVWFRVYLTAADEEGLSETEYVEINPNLKTIKITTTPDDFDVILDGGIEAPTPLDFRSVAGNTRNIVAPQLYPFEGGLYEFVEWSNGESSNLLEFAAGEFDSINADYEYLYEFHTGMGDGLYGELFENTAFSGAPVFSRIDPELNFYWVGFPYENGFANDNFAVRWRGAVQAPITGDYTFTIEYDDFASIQFNGETELLDFEKKGFTTSTFEVSMVAGEKYPIVIELVEELWFAHMKFFWEYENQSQQIVPQEYLYSDTNLVNNISVQTENELILYPNPTNSYIRILTDSLQQEFEVSIYSANGQLRYYFQNTRQLRYGLPINVEVLERGVYLVKITDGSKSFIGKFMKE